MSTENPNQSPEQTSLDSGLEKLNALDGLIKERKWQSVLNTLGDYRQQTFQKGYSSDAFEKLQAIRTVLINEIFPLPAGGSIQSSKTPSEIEEDVLNLMTKMVRDSFENEKKST